MGDIGDEGPAELVLVFEGRRHGVERAAEVPELSRSGPRPDPRRRPTEAHRADRGRQTPNRSHHPAGHDDADDQGAHDSEPRAPRHRGRERGPEVAVAGIQAPGREGDIDRAYGAVGAARAIGTVARGDRRVDHPGLGGFGGVGGAGARRGRHGEHHAAGLVAEVDPDSCLLDERRDRAQVRLRPAAGRRVGTAGQGHQCAGRAVAVGGGEVAHVALVGDQHGHCEDGDRRQCHRHEGGGEANPERSEEAVAPHAKGPGGGPSGIRR